MSVKTYFNKTSVNLFLLSLLVFGINTPLLAAILTNTPIVDSRIVFFNDGSVSGNNSVNVYVDKHFNTALKSNEYTIFCVAPGEHSLESYVNDAPKYTGKNNPQMTATTQSGHTYFLSVTSQGTPLAVLQDAGARAIKNARLSQFINRSPSVIPCTETKITDDKFTVTFSFNGSQISDIPAAELKSFEDWIKKFYSENDYRRIEVVGYSDELGQKTYNYTLSERRAKVIRDVLINIGFQPTSIFVQGKGDSDIKNTCETTSEASTKSCNQVNRRVTVKVIK
ncbi:OmpA family protein [Rosenbergiella epipactidis]|uniref:OmpA family protein n=1 Tax=Rosenbergiella epipactidis TaxID=1544694 RepID=UPI001BDA20A2|nr:OmpA family protein [Rosenbergiella epipactidis]MBT0717240.1 OmpA family protein [Rosenbergiella epipactidis]